MIRGVVSLAGITDLRTFGAGAGYCNASVEPLIGGSPQEFSDRYTETNPIEQLPLGIPLRIVHGDLDPIVPIEQSEKFVRAAKSKGDDAQLTLIQSTGHFELIAPFSTAWARVKQTILSLL